jgi:hypothetical protein
MKSGMILNLAKCMLILFFASMIMWYFGGFSVIETLVETPTYNNTRAQYDRDMSSIQKDLTQIDSDVTNLIKNVSGGMYGNTISGNTKIRMENDIKTLQNEMNLNGVIFGLEKIQKK